MNKKITILILAALVVFGALLFWKFFDSKEVVNMVEEKIVSPKTEEEKESAENPISFQYLTERTYEAPAIKIGEVIENTSDYKKHNATYQSDNLTISGVIYIPIQAPPQEGYPVLVTNHGHIDTSIYTTGRGLKREQGYFATRGYVVFHPDYRNHAGSSKTEDDPIQDRLGYIADVIHAVESLRSSDLKINRNNITLLGHSMGGGATLAAALIKPEVTNRIVLYAPVTVNYLDSYKRWQARDSDRVAMISAKYGAPDKNPEFWAGLNGEPFYGRLSVPVQIYHGTNDQDVPYDWATKMRDDLKAANKDVELITYEGEGHEFSFAWTRFMEGVEAFTKKQ